jgi:hypothetical protein
MFDRKKYMKKYHRKWYLKNKKEIIRITKLVEANKEDIKKGKDLYSKEFDELEDKEIREFVRKYPMEKVLSYYLINK